MRTNQYTTLARTVLTIITLASCAACTVDSAGFEHLTNKDRAELSKLLNKEDARVIAFSIE